MRQAEALAVDGVAEVEVGRAAPQRRVQTRATLWLLTRATPRLHLLLVAAVVEEAVVVAGVVVEAQPRQVRRL